MKANQNSDIGFTLELLVIQGWAETGLGYKKPDQERIYEDIRRGFSQIEGRFSKFSSDPLIAMLYSGTVKSIRELEAKTDKPRYFKNLKLPRTSRSQEMAVAYDKLKNYGSALHGAQRIKTKLKRGTYVWDIPPEHELPYHLWSVVNLSVNRSGIDKKYPILSKVGEFVWKFVQDLKDNAHVYNKRISERDALPSPSY